MFMFFGWFSTVIDENQHGAFNNPEVDRSFRMGMIWFIFSEVMFFAAFFGALFYARMLSVPWIGGEGVKVVNKLFLWKNYDPTWPTNGPAHIGPARRRHLRSHPGLRHAGTQHRDPAHQRRHGHHRAPRAAEPAIATVLKFWLALTFLLGFTFVEPAGARVRRGLSRARVCACRPASTVRPSSC